MGNRMPPLQHREWPPVPAYTGLPRAFEEFCRLGHAEQQAHLVALRADPATHGETLHRFLSVVSSYLFGYADSPTFRRADDALELAILQAKMVLERELLDHWLDVGDHPTGLDPHEAVAYLRRLRDDNSCVAHPLFDYIERDASHQAIRMFLRNEVTRNEVVDDEVAMMLVGLQGPMKLAISSNLWDECGRGRLTNFHTYWLRRLLEHTSDWDDLVRYREGVRPWFTQITTNVFNILLTRPGLRLMAYGWFLINESWVAPHFAKILTGIERVGLDVDDVTIYFAAHMTIDPRHTDELTGAIAAQEPPLSTVEADQVVRGAHLAIAANKAQYDLMAGYLAAVTEGAREE
jgi:Iron-containing redox enzyme